jgi:hypothetical protein
MAGSGNDCFPRGTLPPAQSPLYWVQEKDRYLRQLLIRDIQADTGRELIVYFTDCNTPAQIDPSDEQYLVELLGACRGKVIDLLLETNGGVTDATEKVVAVLKNWDCDLRVIVANRAKSNGTVIALVGKSIVMGPNSELGPVDPNIHIGEGQFAPAQFIMNLDPAQVAPITRLFADFAIRQTKKLARQALGCRMLPDKTEDQLDEIVEKLATRDVYHSHGSVIDHSEAQALGLTVEILEPSDPTWKKLWLLRCMYQADAPAKRLGKIFEGERISSSVAAPATG